MCYHCELSGALEWRFD
ncbi:hypothetical protein LINPERPRIM_LOCUS31749 [Linum perenne]